MPKVVFLPERIEIKVEPHSVLLDILRQVNRDVLSLCGGMGECETCVVDIHAFNNNNTDEAENNPGFQRVLSCQTHVTQDILVHIPDWRTLFQ